MSKVKTWTISYSQNVWTLRVVEKNRLGVFFQWFLDVTCLCKIGNYHPALFCWINPWSWTWHVGTERHNLGGAWWSFGNMLYGKASKMEKEQVKYTIPLTNAQIKEHFPDSWTWILEMFDEEYLEECETQAS